MRLFESAICAPSLVIYLDCPKSILQARLLERARATPRVDDRKMKERFKIFMEKTSKVLTYYSSQGKLAKIDASRVWVKVYKEIQQIVTIYHPYWDIKLRPSVESAFFGITMD